MNWSKSLIRVSTYEVETLQKRLAEIVGRRQDLEMRLAMIAAQGEAEAVAAQRDAEAAMLLAGFRAGLKYRMAAVQADIDLAAAEEAGAREALALAFETLKKYEHVAEAAALLQRREAARRETAALDEIGLRRAYR